MNFNNVSKKMMNRVFRRVTGLAWDMTTGKVGIKTKDDSIFTYTAGTEAVAATDLTAAVPANEGFVTTSLFDMSMAIPAFAMATPLSEVQESDLLVGETKVIGWVTRKTAQSVFVIDHTGHVKQFNAPRVNVGFPGMPAAGGTEPTYMVVRNFFSLAGGQAGANSALTMMLPMLMAGESGTSELEELLPMILMTNMAAPAAVAPGAVAPAAANPMAAMMPMIMAQSLSGGNSGGKSMMKMMMMQQAMASGNPMLAMMMMGKGDSFGGLGSFDDGDEVRRTELPAPGLGRTSIPALRQSR